MFKKDMTKIEGAIYDTKMRLNHTKERIMLLSKERDVLQDQLDTLELIKNDNEYKKDQ